VAFVASLWRLAIGDDSLARMLWQRLETTPIDIDTGIDPAVARTVADALSAHAVPVVARRDGRIEPLASGAFYRAGERLWLATCRHVFDDGAALGDLGVALPAAGRVCWLREARPRLLAHPRHDLAAILIGAGSVEREIRRAWPVLPLGQFDDTPAQALVLAAYPYAQMRRIESVLHARPVVVFARWLPSDADVRASYARFACRADGQRVHAPPLDGASGATLWALRAFDEHGRCLLQPAAVQFAFKHDAYMRGAPFSALRDLFLSVH
jgi:hypothetical protein